MAKRDKPLVRPLSPFMHYMGPKTWSTMVLSIVHRMTGLAGTVGLAVLVYWLTAAAMGPDAYARAQACFASWPMQIVLLGLVFSFCYHALNGIRHLVWDTGRGFEMSTSRKSGLAMVVGAVLSTALIVYVFVVQRGAL